VLNRKDDVHMTGRDSGIGVCRNHCYSIGELLQQIIPAAKEPQARPRFSTHRLLIGSPPRGCSETGAASSGRAL
jgi:hypothetical protein